MLGQSDRDVVESIAENPYLQFFLGDKSCSVKAPFDASLMSSFRKRLPSELVNKLNLEIVAKNMKSKEPDDGGDGPDGGAAKPEEQKESKNEGTLLMDASCRSIRQTSAW